jgi:hypothetical protein
MTSLRYLDVLVAGAALASTGSVVAVTCYVSTIEFCCNLLTGAAHPDFGQNCGDRNIVDPIVAHTITAPSGSSNVTNQTQVACTWDDWGYNTAGKCVFWASWVQYCTPTVPSGGACTGGT